ncbi:MAG: metallophosphoesterase family protein [Prolixibacteraceae bacterium]|nr:metallophosphoesterase family protein [Prolixibacteraceae bacterium]
MRYAIIADIHEDIVNLRLALKKIEKQHCNEVICLGDISGYSASHNHYSNTRNARECLKILRENCKIIIAGNHDLHAIRKIPGISPGFCYPENWYDMDYQERFTFSNGKVWLYENDELNPLYTKADIEFLKTLPEFDVLAVKQHNILLSHYIYPNLTGASCEFFTAPHELEQHASFITEKNCFASFAGHRHYSGLFIASNHHIVKKRYYRTYTLKRNDCILVPPVSVNQIGNGFCIFDSEDFTVEAKRI